MTFCCVHEATEGFFFLNIFEIVKYLFCLCEDVKLDAKIISSI